MQPKPEKTKHEDNFSAMRYVGLGFQIAGTIGAGVALGWFLDKKLATPKPYFTIVCSMVFLVAGMYLGFKDLLKVKK